MKKIEELFLRLQKANEEKQIGLLISISKQYRNSNNSQALEYAEMARKLAVKLNRDLDKADALRLINSIKYSQGKYCEVIDSSEEYLKIYKTYNNVEGICWSLSRLGQCYRKLDDYVQSLNYLNKALKLAKSGNYRIIIISIQNSIALIYIDLGKYEEANIYLKQILEKEKKKFVLCSVYNNLALNAEKQHFYPLAKKYIQKALEYANQLDKKRFIIGSMCNLGSILLAEKKYLQAVKILEDANSRIKDNDLGYELKIEILNNLGYSFFKINKLIKAELIINQSLLLARNCNETNFIILNLDILKKIALSKKDYQKAYEILAEIGEIKRNRDKKKELSRLELEKLKMKLQAQKQADNKIAIYKNIMEETTGFMSYVDRDYIYLQVNNALLQAYNKKRSEIVGHTLLELLGETTFNTIVKKRIDLCLDGEKVHYKDWFDYRGIGKRYMSINYHPHFDENNNVLGVIIKIEDMTKQKINAENLRKSEEKFRTIANFTYDWEYWLDTDGNFLYCSPACKRITGFSAEEFLQNPKLLEEITHPDDYNIVKSHAHGIIEEIHHQVEFRIITKSGETRWIGHLCQTIYDNENRNLGIRGSNRDITEKKQAELLLHKEKILYHQLVTSVKDWIWEMDADGNHTYSNPAVKDVLGYNVKEVVGYNVTKFWVNTKNIDESKKYLMKKLQTGKGWNNIIGSFVHKDGSKVITESSATPIFDKHHVLVGYRGIDHDITARVQGEKKLQASENTLKKAQSLAKIGSWDFDILQNKLTWSDEVYDIFQFEKNEREDIYNLFIKAIHPDDREFMMDAYKKSLRNKSVYNIAHRLLLKDGSIKYVNERCENFYNELGEAVQSIGTVQDISERKITELKLKEYSKTQKTLLREVNHRVKNNLAVLISILHKAQDQAEEKGLKASTVFAVLEERILGLANVHSLFSESYWQPIKISELCKQIVGSSIDNLFLLHQAKLEISESDIMIGSTQAHHLTMILNELAFNSLKYGINKQRFLKITIDIKKIGNNIKLVFADNGNGYPQKMLDGDFTEIGVGFQLINGIILRSMAGDIKIENDFGARTTIIFEVED